MSELIVKCISLNMFGMNSYIISKDDEAIIIDIAKLTFGYDDYKKLLDGKKLTKIIYTHGHFDHISGSDDIREIYPDVKHYAPKLDYNFFQDANLNASAYFGQPITCKEPEYKLEENDIITLKDIEFKVIHTPGHTHGGVCFYTKGYLFAGDTIFSAGIGRYDLPTGDYDTLIKSIEEKIFTLDDDTLVYPGHGEYGFSLKQRKKLNLF